MKKLFVIIIFAFAFCSTSTAQSFEVPKDYRFKNKGDYSKYEPDIIKLADWMQQTPWTAQKAKSDAAGQFLLAWIQGTPDVVIELTQSIMNLSDVNPQLGFTFIAQFSKYALQHKGAFDKKHANMEALRAVIAKYNAEPTHKRDDDVEILISMDKEGKLEEWVNNDFHYN
jgi:hypothetical protein